MSHRIPPELPEQLFGHRPRRQGRTPSRMLFGDAVGTTLDSPNPAAANSPRNSASVRILPPDWLSSIKMSNDLAGLGSLPEGMSISITSTFPFCDMASRHRRRILLESSSLQSIKTLLRM